MPRPKDKEELWKFSAKLSYQSTIQPRYLTGIMARILILFRHPANLVMLAAVVIGLMVLVGQAPWWAWALILLGIPAQMLNEYSLHRYIFHLPPPDEQWKFDLLYQAHYGHHDFPTNHGLFFVPPWISLPMLAGNFLLVWAVAYFIAPDHALSIAAAIVLVGGVSTFLAYEWFHMTAHLSVRKNRVERQVATLHGQHHYRDFHRWYHVSPGGQIIDRMMGTAISREELKSKQRVEFITTLGLHPNDPRLISARIRYAEKYALSQQEIADAARLA